MRRELAFAAACALVLAAYAWSLAPNLLQLAGGNGSGAYYNLLVDGFRGGRLSLKREAPPGLARLAHPYDRAANEPFRVGLNSIHDLSYFQGRLYLYFGITPALLLFWPWAALTGGYLAHAQAAWFGCAAGFLAGAGLVRALWRRYFPEIPAAVAAAAVLGLGLAGSELLLLQRPEVWEVPISCAFALVTLALAATWQALHRPQQRGRWLAAASLALGLAVGARPLELGAAALLLVPLWAEARAPGRRPVQLARLVFLAAGPIALCGLGLAWYNEARFHHLFEFGQSFQLSSQPPDDGPAFAVRYLGFEFWNYFLAPVHWARSFPFVVLPRIPESMPAHGTVEDTFGILANVPLAAFALAAPLAWRGRNSAERAGLSGFAAAAGLAVLGVVLPLLFFIGTCSRYELEFLPALLLLAVLGCFGLERRLAAQPGWRWAVRGAAGFLLAYSLAFSGLAAASRCAQERLLLGSILSDSGEPKAGIAQLRIALQLAPGVAEAHNNLANALLRAGRTEEAEAQYSEAIRLDPGSAAQRYNLGNLLVREGRAAEAVLEYQAALQRDPNYAEVHYNLAVALFQLGRPAEAEAHYREALRLKPDMDPRRRQAAPQP